MIILFESFIEKGNQTAKLFSLLCLFLRLFPIGHKLVTISNDCYKNQIPHHHNRKVKLYSLSCFFKILHFFLFKSTQLNTKGENSRHEKLNFHIIKVGLNRIVLFMDAKRRYNTKEALFRPFYLHGIILYLLQSLLAP